MSNFYLIRPCRSSYMDKSGLRRWLKPHLAHGAWIIGPGTRQDLSYRRLHTDIEMPADEVPKLQQFAHRAGTWLSARDLREVGISVPTIPESGWRRWWWTFWNDDGLAR